jgi:hypothetical protein
MLRPHNTSRADVAKTRPLACADNPFFGIININLS